MAQWEGFGSALSSIRQARGLTQEDFSDVSSRTYVSTLERGLKSPTLEKVDRIASKLRVHPATLLVLGYARAQDHDPIQVLERISSELSNLGISVTRRRK